MSTSNKDFPSLLELPDVLAWLTDRSTKSPDSSNPSPSTNQSLAYRTFQRIEENPRVCARFAFACGPRERRRGRKSPKFCESSLRAISLCPTPCDRRGADWVGSVQARDSLFFRSQRVPNPLPIWLRQSDV